MNIATAKCASLNKIWKDHCLPRKFKMGLYIRSVCMVFAHGSETWSMAPSIQRSINSFKSRCLHKITGLTYQSAENEPTYDPHSADARKQTGPPSSYHICLQWSSLPSKLAAV